MDCSASNTCIGRDNVVYFHFVTEKLQIDNHGFLSQGRGVKLKVLENKVGQDGSVAEVTS